MWITFKIFSEKAWIFKKIIVYLHSLHYIIV
jgi:hypothetical protein